MHSAGNWSSQHSPGAEPAPRIPRAGSGPAAAPGQRRSPLRPLPLRAEPGGGAGWVTHTHLPRAAARSRAGQAGTARPGEGGDRRLWRRGPSRGKLPAPLPASPFPSGGSAPEARRAERSHKNHPGTGLSSRRSGRASSQAGAEPGRHLCPTPAALRPSPRPAPPPPPARRGAVRAARGGRAGEPPPGSAPFPSPRRRSQLGGSGPA